VIDTLVVFAIVVADTGGCGPARHDRRHGAHFAARGAAVQHAVVDYTPRGALHFQHRASFT